MTVRDFPHCKWIIIPKLYIYSNCISQIPIQYPQVLLNIIDYHTQTIKHNVWLILYDLLWGLWPLGRPLVGSWLSHGPTGLVTSFKTTTFGSSHRHQRCLSNMLLAALRHSTYSPKRPPQIQHQNHNNASVTLPWWHSCLPFEYFYLPPLRASARPSEAYRNSFPSEYGVGLERHIGKWAICKAEVQALFTLFALGGNFDILYHMGVGLLESRIQE